MNRKFVFSILALVALSLAGTAVYAKTYKIKELNSGPGGTFVFEPDFLPVQPGDSVQFVPTDPGHNAKSYFLPKGAKGWEAGISKSVTVKLSKNGVYLYECVPHHTFGMLGVIVVGKPVNKAAAENAAKAMEAKVVLNKGRLKKLMAKVK